MMMGIVAAIIRAVSPWHEAPVIKQHDEPLTVAGESPNSLTEHGGREAVRESTSYMRDAAARIAVLTGDPFVSIAHDIRHAGFRNEDNGA